MMLQSRGENAQTGVNSVTRYLRKICNHQPCPLKAPGMSSVATSRHSIASIIHDSMRPSVDMDGDYISSLDI